MDTPRCYLLLHLPCSAFQVLMASVPECQELSNADCKDWLFPKRSVLTTGYWAPRAYLDFKYSTWPHRSWQQTSLWNVGHELHIHTVDHQRRFWHGSFKHKIWRMCYGEERNTAKCSMFHKTFGPIVLTGVRWTCMHIMHCVFFLCVSMTLTSCKLSNLNSNHPKFKLSRICVTLLSVVEVLIAKGEEG